MLQAKSTTFLLFTFTFTLLLRYVTGLTVKVAFVFDKFNYTVVIMSAFDTY